MLTLPAEPANKVWQWVDQVALPQSLDLFLFSPALGFLPSPSFVAAAHPRRE
jgi:hypothetical protein